MPSAVNSISTEQRTKQSEQQLRKRVDELFEKSSTNKDGKLNIQDAEVFLKEMAPENAAVKGSILAETRD